MSFNNIKLLDFKIWMQLPVVCDQEVVIHMETGSPRVTVTTRESRDRGSTDDRRIRRCKLAFLPAIQRIGSQAKSLQDSLGLGDFTVLL